MKRTIMKSIATLGPVGYLPAGGTWASLLTVLAIYLLHLLQVSWTVYGLIVMAVALLSFYVIKQSQDVFKNPDASEIVIDETVGCLITFWFIPFDFYTALIGFSLFRLFDITKILGISWLEYQGKTLSVMLDDIGAAVLSNLLLQLFLWFKMGI